MPRLAKSQKNKKNLEVHCRVQIYHSVKWMQSAPKGEQASSMSLEPIFTTPNNFAPTVVRHSPKFQLRRFLHACVYSLRRQRSSWSCGT